MGTAQTMAADGERQEIDLFMPPAEEEVMAYARAKGYPENESRAAFAELAASGWMTKDGQRAVCWKKAFTQRVKGKVRAGKLARIARKAKKLAEKESMLDMLSGAIPASEAAGLMHCTEETLACEAANGMVGSFASGEGSLLFTREDLEAYASRIYRPAGRQGADSPEAAALKARLEDAAKQAGEAAMRIDALEKENGELRKNEEFWADAAEKNEKEAGKERQKARDLQERLDEKLEKIDGCTIRHTEKLFYSEEIKQLILDLVGKRLNDTGTVLGNEHVRSIDLMQNIIDCNPMEGQRDAKRAEIRKAVEDTVQNGDLRPMERAGFTNESAPRAPHAKMLFNDDPRYCIVLSGSPSDWRTDRNISALALKMIIV